MKSNSKPDKSRVNIVVVLSVVLYVLNAITGFSQTPTEEIIKSTFQTSSSENSGLFVLQFSASGITESAARFYSNAVAQNIANTNRFNVIYLNEAEDTIHMAAPELLPCFDIGCGIQIGNHLKVKWIVSGHIALTEAGSFILKVKLVNVYDNSIEFEDTVRFNDENMDRRIYLLCSRIAQSVPLIGTIVEANNKLAIISVGKKDGISIGDQFIVYRKDTIQTVTSSGATKKNVRRKNIAIIKITQIGERISEGVYFQSIEIPKPDQFVSTFLDKRRQIRLIDHVRKELDTYERNVHEITEKIDLSPIQLINIDKNKWISRVKAHEESRWFWQYCIIGSGMATAYFIKEYVGSDEKSPGVRDWRLLTSVGILGYSLYRYITINNQFNKLLDEGRYKGYLDLKISPELDGAELGFHLMF